eukprot:COSAG02_NODE_48167_length_335_cov_2.944915_1_plen_37_part_01
MSEPVSSFKLEVGNLRFLVLPPSHIPNSVSGGLTYPT